LKLGDEYYIGEELAFRNNTIRIYSCVNHPDIEIKVECAFRPPLSFYEEVKVQKKVAAAGYAVKIHYYEIDYYPSSNGDDKLFYITVVDKSDYSLNDVQTWFPFLGDDGLNKIGIQLIKGLKSIHAFGYLLCEMNPNTIMVSEVNSKFYMKFSDFSFVKSISEKEP
jgi:serine/threonine protein kinase